MKKHVCFLLVGMAAIALLLSSCGSPILSLSDQEVSFDSSGYVTKVVAYTNYSSSAVETITFSTDGTYENSTKSWDSASSSWKESSGDKGTYSYSTSSRTLTCKYDQEWNGTSYVALTSASTSTTKTITESVILGSSNMYLVGEGSNGTYTVTEKMSYWDGTSQAGTMTVTIASDLSTLTLTQESESYNAGNVVTGGNKDTRVYTADNIFPSSVTSLEKAKGKVATFTYLKYADTPYTWSSGTTFTMGTATTSNSGGSLTISMASDASNILLMDYANGYTLSRDLPSK